MTSIDTVAVTRMKVTCTKDELAEKLAVAGRGVSTRTASVQILAGIMLAAEDGKLSLSATDMEISLRVSLDAQVEESGSVVVPGRLLVDIVRLLPGGEVTLEARPEEGIAELVCGGASYRLHTYAAEDFPRLPEIDEATAFSVEREAFLETIARVSRSASRDESRPVLTGVLVRFEGEKLVMAATDSYRLSVKETALARSPGQELEAIVPARALSELARVGQSATSDEIAVGVQENQVVFGVDGVWLTARRIDGQFPNYKQLLPETFEAEITLPREEFLEVVRRASLMAQRKSPLRLRFEEGELTVSAQTQDVGEARESLPAPYSGEVLEIGFNAEFLRDGLESVTDDNVRFKLISPLRPGLIHGEADDFLYLIMPIRLAG
jgi:DNA polymerase-3 subunit beta